MASDQFSLHWDNFHNNMSSGMNSLLENEDLVDVTLAVEGKYLKAHKIVLSVCSPYFKELFKANPCKHPIVFMKDVSYVALSDLLQFMYQGEVQVSQDSLTAFIKTAEALQIKGLTGDNGSNENDVELEKPMPVSQPTVPQPIVQDYKPISKQRKIPPPPISAPPPKRSRLLSDSSQASTTKLEPISNLSSTSNSDQIVQFKMEPYDQNQSISLTDDNPDETFGDDNTLDDTAIDDTEDYSMMEGAEEEPQAGTSADGAGEGQGIIYFEPGRKNARVIVNYHTYELNKRKYDKTYWMCLNYYKTKCKSRLVTYGDCAKICGSKYHNHGPTFRNVSGLYYKTVRFT